MKTWLFGVSLLILCGGISLSQEPQTANGALQSALRFQGQVMFHVANGATRTVSVTVRNWSIAGGSIDRFPEPGLAMVQLLAGRLTTTIDGKTEDRNTGDVWSVPSVSSMGVTVKRETAVIQTISLQ